MPVSLLRRSLIALCVATIGILAAPVSIRAQVDPESLPHVGFHLGGIAYWDTPYFANALWTGGPWVEYEEGQWGSSVSHWNNPQFDENGFPQYLNEGRKLRGISYGLHTNYDNRHSTWPRRNRLAQGRVVLEWKGEADIRLNAGGTYLDSESSGAATGLLTDGRRVYRYTGGYVQWLEVHEIGSNPITDIRIWLPDPADPENQSLEDQVFHPTFLERLADADWGFIRFMNFQQTNANPQQDWSDRRPPAHVFQEGPLNPRAPATGTQGNRGSGCALELLPMLCNETDKDLWLSIPHLATEDFVRRTARLIRFGSDGTNPYTEPTADPVYPPLREDLRIYVEYSNEIWASGFSFPQGDWAQEQANAAGITKPRFNARRFCDIWSIFQEEFDGTGRLVRVAAVFTAADWYTQPFLEEIAAYGPTLSPAVEPDVIAVTTYFGNDIQGWAYETARDMAGTDDPWFLTTEMFDAGGGNMRPVSISASDTYWTSGVYTHIDATFDEWRRRMLAGDARAGAGPDQTGVGGGFSPWLRDLAATVFPSPVPIIAYEGGPSIYTDSLDGGDPRDDGLTTFMEILNRQPAMQEVYRIHLNMAKAKGLWSHVMFTDTSKWSKWGQWGHLEYLDQPIAEAPKYAFLLDWMTEQTSIRHIDMPQGSVPAFQTDSVLPVAIWGESYDVPVATEGGNGERTLALIGSQLVDGLQWQPVGSDGGRITGTPSEAGMSYVYLRVTDEDGDPAWRTFSVRTVGGPDTLLECDFTGSNPAQQTPWTNTYVIADGLQHSGWTPGAGILARPGDNALTWAVNAPPDESSATLSNAIDDNEYWSINLTPSADRAINLRGHEVRFTIRRIDWHAPRRYAVMTSVDGFTANDAVYTSNRFQSTDDLEFVFTLPDEPGWEQLTEPFELRLYGYSAQYGGHQTSLLAFRMSGEIIHPAFDAETAWHLF